jgi:hypothetical protein
MAERGRFVDEEAFGIRTAVAEAARHRAHRLHISAGAGDAANATHFRIPYTIMAAMSGEDEASGWFRPRFLGAALGLVVFLRGLYLVRFGWDPGWMNVTYLLRAKQFVMGAPFRAEEPPLTPFLLVVARTLGLSATGALAAVYLLCHLVLFLGILGLAWLIWPSADRRRRACVVLTAALLPLLACETGRNNLGVLVGAAFATCAVSLMFAFATLPRFSAWRMLLGVATAIFAGLSRMESLATCGAAAALLLVLGARLDGTKRARVSGLILAGAAATSYAIGLHFRPDVPSDYAFYTFYDGLPFLLYPKFTLSEYERYHASVRYFGSFEENHGSLLRALIAHPLWAIARVAAKAVDMLGVLLWPQSLTPIGVAAAISGLKQRALVSWDRVWLLAAFLPALAVLYIPFSNPHYYLSIAAPLVLVVARGCDRWTRSLSSATAQKLATASIVIMAGLIAWVGRWEPSSSRTINEASAWLEARCRDGCLANVVPQSLERQTWVDLQRNARIVRGHSRSEASISGEWAKKHERDYNFCERVTRARAAGFLGPVLFIDARIRSYRAFDPDFDPEVRFQGQVDLAGALEEKRFASGEDELVIYRLPGEVRCN